MPNLLVNGGEILWIIIFAGAAGIVVFIERALHCHRAQINSTEFLNGVRTVIKRDNIVEAISICDATPGPVSRLVKTAILNRDHGRVDKRTMYEESIRVPLIVRYPPLIPKSTVINEMVLNLDLAPSLIDLGSGQPLTGIDGQSWKPLLAGNTTGWRKSWLYFYNYEKEFPYTPNVRGVRTASWKYIYYPSGDGTPSRYGAELYNLATDPLEVHNLIADPAAARQLAELKKESARLMAKHKAVPDRMPPDGGIINVLPKF